MDLLALIERCAPQVAPTTMQRIIAVESTQKPHAIGYKVTKHNTVYTLTKQPRDVQQAISWAHYLLQNGYRFDAGVAQINSANFARLGLTAQTVFDACTNITASAQILSEFYASASAKYGKGQPALLAAISAYQSGNFHTGFATGYVQKVAGITLRHADYNPPLALTSQRRTLTVETHKKPTAKENPYDTELEAKAFQ